MCRPKRISHSCRFPFAPSFQVADVSASSRLAISHCFFCNIGLIVYEQGKKEEGRNLCTAAIKADSSQFFVWDVVARVREQDQLIPGLVKFVFLFILI